MEHRTTYHFDRSVGIGPHIVRLRPAPHARTPIESYSLTVSPTDHFVNWQQDPFGNYLARLVFPKKSDKLEITVGLVADMGVINPFDFFIEEYAEGYPFTYPASLAADLEPYLATVEDTPGAGPDRCSPAGWRPFRSVTASRPSTSWCELNTKVYSDVGLLGPDGTGRADARQPP